MINQLYKYLLQFIVLILLQVMVLNNVQYTIGLNPNLYVLFILMLPFETAHWLLLAIAFVTGMTVDVFSDSIGLHAAACVMIAFIRPYLLELIVPNDGYRANSFPSIKHYGFEWFLKYSIAMVFFHHTFLVFYEAFSFSGFFSSLLTIVEMTIISMILIVLSQYLSYKK